MTSRSLSSALGMAACMLFTATIAPAREFRHNVAFSAVNQNPWAPGRGFQEEFHFDDLQTTFNVDLPRLSGNPINIIADFLGVDLPVDSNVGVGGSVSGSFGLDFGYYVSGGRLNMKYPARSVLDIETYQDTNIIVASQIFSVDSDFLPGVTARTISGALLVANAGAGYGQTTVPDFTYETFSTPEFGTTFPYASAWATLGYDIRGGAFAEASLKALGGCIICARREAKFGDAREITLVEIDPNGLYIANGQFGVELFDQTIPVGGFGNVTLSYPDVRVGASGVGPDNSLQGFGSKPIVSLQGQVEKLVPFIGPFLANNIGPFGYELLTTQGGPVLSLYQDFTFTPQPRVQLLFSEPVMHREADGVFRPTNYVEFAVGDDVELRTILSTNRSLTVRPTYFLNNTFRNETGLSLGVTFDVEVLNLTTPLGEIGPAVHQDFDFSNLVQVPVFEESFEIPLNPVTANDIVLDKWYPSALVRSAQAFLTEATLRSQDPETGLTTYALRLFGRGAGQNDRTFVMDFPVTGTEVFLPWPDGSDNTQTILLTESDVMAAPIDDPEDLYNLGNAFCITCIDSSIFFDAVNPAFLGDDGELLYLARQFEFDDGLVDVAADPFLTVNNFIDHHTVVPMETPPTEHFLVGDYNGNGHVEQGDLDLVLLNWGRDGTMAPSGWVNDLPAGSIDQAELDGVLLNWGNTSATVANANASAAVPEPPGVLLAAVLLLLTLPRR